MTRGLLNGFGIIPRRPTGGGAPLAPPAYSPTPALYESDFSAVANGALLRNQPGWAVYQRDGLTLPSRDDCIIRQPQSDIWEAGVPVDFTTVGENLIGIETSSARHAMEIEVTFAGSSVLGMALGAPHNGNYIDVRMYGQKVGQWTGASGAEVYGGDLTDNLTRTYFSATARGLSNRDLPIGTKLRAKALGTDLFLTANGLPYGRYTIAATTGTRAGVSTNSAKRYRAIKSVKVNPVETVFTVDPIKGWYNRIVNWRGWANGGRRITVTGTYKGKKPEGLRFQLPRYTDGSIIQNWVSIPYAQTVITRLTGTDADGTGTWTAQVDIECGLDGVNPYGFTIGSGSANPDWNNGSYYGYFYICVGFVLYGQSEIAGANATVVGAGYPDTPGCCIYQMKDPSTLDFTEQPYYEATAWGRDQTDQNSLRDRQTAWFTSHLSKAYGLPVSATIVALGARLSSSLGPVENGTDWNEIKRHLTFIGCYEHVVAGQGSAEMNAGGAAAWTTNTATNIEAYYAYLNQPVSHVPYWFMVPTGFGNIPGEVGTGAQQGNANSIRAQQLAFPAYMAGRPTPRNVVYSCSFTDLDVDGSGEFTDGLRSGGEGLRRVALTIAKTLNKTGGGLGVIDGRGPTVSAVQKISNTLIRVTYNLNGSTGLSGTNLSEHRVFSDAAGTTPIAITGAVNVINATQIDIPIASTAGNVWWTDYWNFGPVQTGRAIGAYAAINDGAPSSGALTIPAMFNAELRLAA